MACLVPFILHRPAAAIALAPGEWVEGEWRDRGEPYRVRRENPAAALGPKVKRFPIMTLVFREGARLEQGFFPSGYQGAASVDGIGPGVGMGTEVVAVAHAEFGTDPELVAGAGSGEPAGEKIFGEGEVVLKFRSGGAAAVGNGNLTVMAVERPEMKHLGVLDKLRPSEQTGGEGGRHQMFGYSEVGMIPSHGEKLAGSFLIEAGDLGKFFRSLGGRIPVGLDVDGQAQLTRGAEQGDGGAGGLAGGRIVIEELEVDELDAEVALLAEAGQGSGHTLGVEAAHED